MRVIVCGAGGFIGTHLTKRLKSEGHYVIGIDRKQPEFEKSEANEFITFDLRQLKPNDALFSNVNEVYQLAAEMGGMGYLVPENDATVMHNSVQINLNVLEVCRYQKIPRVFFSSSACVYPPLRGALNRGHREYDAYPAHPDLEYGWEKLFSERLYDSYRRCYGVETRIGRFHNVYGPLGTWRGGREKAPAAICRKVAEAANDGLINVWGDGEQRRSFMYIDDAIEGIVRLMRSDIHVPVNLGSEEMVTIADLVRKVILISGKRLGIHYVDGPVGVSARNSDNAFVRDNLGWEPRVHLDAGLRWIYSWVKQQVALHETAIRVQNSPPSYERLAP